MSEAMVEDGNTLHPDMLFTELRPLFELATEIKGAQQQVDTRERRYFSGKSSYEERELALGALITAGAEMQALIRRQEDLVDSKRNEIVERYKGVRVRAESVVPLVKSTAHNPICKGLYSCMDVDRIPYPYKAVKRGGKGRITNILTDGSLVVTPIGLITRKPIREVSYIVRLFAPDGLPQVKLELLQ